MIAVFPDPCDNRGRNPWSVWLPKKHRALFVSTNNPAHEMLLNLKKSVHEHHLASLAILSDLISLPSEKIMVCLRVKFSFSTSTTGNGM